MEIVYTLTEENYLNFNLYHTSHSKTIKKSLMIQRLMGPVLFIIFSFVFPIVANLPFLGLFITFLVLSILWYTYYPKYFYNLIMRQVKKAINEGNNDGLLGKHRMTLTEDRLIDVTDTGKTEVLWSGMKELKEDDDNLYLYNSAMSAYILPKKDIHEFDKIKLFLQNKIQ